MDFKERGYVCVDSDVFCGVAKRPLVTIYTVEINDSYLYYLNVTARTSTCSSTCHV